MCETEDDLSLKMTDVTADVYQNEPKKNVNLRSGPKQVVKNPKKKVVVPTKQQSDPVSKKKQIPKNQKKNMEVEEVNKIVQNFNLKNELGKIKIPMPLTKLMKNLSYKELVLKMISLANNQPISDTVNLQEENPKIFIGSSLAEKTENEASASPPFYITMTVHEQMIHNCLLDSGASHNLMPKVVMEALGLSITKPYHDLYAFDS